MPGRTERQTVSETPMQRFGLRPDNGWADVAMADVGGCAEEEQAAWLDLFAHLSTARPADPERDWPEAQEHAASLCGYEHDIEQPRPEPGSHEYRETLAKAGPTAEWNTKAKRIVDRIGHDRFGARASRWYQEATRSNVATLNRPGPNREMLRALIWCVCVTSCPAMFDRLRQLATWSINHRTNQANTIGIALACAETEDAAAALRLIQQDAKRPSPKQRFARLAEHVERRLGIDAADSAERFVPTYGFDRTGRRRIELAGTVADAGIEGPEITVAWFNDAGKPVKAPPVAVKRTCAAGLKELKAGLTDAGKMLASQRARIEALMAVPKRWSCAVWRERYLDHPIVGTIARRLVWTVADLPVLFVDGNALDVAGNPVSTGAADPIALWHPIGRDPQEVLTWRQRIETLRVTQPFKQVHREVYLLTDAERQTSIYSNRFAGHVIRQHQMKALALARGWTYDLQGAWDGGDTGTASRALPAWDLLAEFWVNGAGDDTADSGIYLYMSTDQVRFYRLSQTNARGRRPEPVRLDEVPPLAFSEVMRDVDLFVGVASVGNDPNWQDGGPHGRNHDYWQSYSFGELGATARTRRAVLERVVTRLKIKDRCSLTDRFLIVRGDLRTYKIHLGSGNILMEPNDQYLCIVPSRGKGAATPDDVFLPFEGDATLSIILSKAFLLAEDTTINDPSITRQIKGQ